ncbi:MAG: hypothetical protein ACTHJX_02230, partial [Terriglobales bacterium]
MLVALALAAPGARAQVPIASLAGVVKSEAGGAVDGALLSLAQSTSGQVTTARSGPQGRLHPTPLAVGPELPQRHGAR